MALGRFWAGVVALAMGSSACSLWFLTTHPLGDGLDASPDEDVVSLGDAAPDAGADACDSTPVAVPPGNVYSITTVGDSLYANVAGELYTCSGDCAALQLLVDAGAVTGLAGISANASGVYWVAQNAICAATLDGGTSKCPAIVDQNFPFQVTADGQRISWTTNCVGGTCIHTCPNAWTGCTFQVVPDAGGASGPIGVLVPTTYNAKIDQTKLASASGYVAWVDTDNYVYLTPESGPVDASVKLVAPASLLDDSFVANDGPTLFWSLYSSSTPSEYFVYRQTTPGAFTPYDQIVNDTGAKIKAPLGLSASAGAVLYTIAGGSLSAADEYDAGASRDYDLAGIARPSQTAATSKWIFFVDDKTNLYRINRCR